MIVDSNPNIMPIFLKNHQIGQTLVRWGVWAHSCCVTRPSDRPRSSIYWFLPPAIKQNGLDFANCYFSVSRYRILMQIRDVLLIVLSDRSRISQMGHKPLSLGQKPNILQDLLLKPAWKWKKLNREGAPASLALSLWSTNCSFWGYVQAYIWRNAESKGEGVLWINDFQKLYLSSAFYSLSP